MKNKEAIEALEKMYDALKLANMVKLKERHFDGIPEAYEKILKALREQQEQSSVDVDQIKNELAHEVDETVYDVCHSLSQPSMNGKTWGEIRLYIEMNVKSAINNKIDRLAEQGYLTLSEKPTNSIPDDVREMYDMIDYFWRWIERAYFDKDLPMDMCVKMLVHSPYAPWNNDREKWDTKHKEYDAEIDKVVAESGWQPIETAPKDGSVFQGLLSRKEDGCEYIPEQPKDCVRPVCITNGSLHIYGDARATQIGKLIGWQPLAQPPVKAAESEG